MSGGSDPLHFLVIDRNPLDRARVADLAQARGWSALMTHDGVMGVAAAMTEAFDGLIIDRDTIGDGLESLARIRAGGPNAQTPALIWDDAPDPGPEAFSALAPVAVGRKVTAEQLFYDWASGL